MLMKTDKGVVTRNIEEIPNRVITLESAYDVVKAVYPNSTYIIFLGENNFTVQ